jgi:hypothetical protein
MSATRPARKECKHWVTIACCMAISTGLVQQHFANAIFLLFSEPPPNSRSLLPNTPLPTHHPTRTHVSHEHAAAAPHSSVLAVAVCVHHRSGTPLSSGGTAPSIRAARTPPHTAAYAQFTLPGACNAALVIVFLFVCAIVHRKRWRCDARKTAYRCGGGFSRSGNLFRSQRRCLCLCISWSPPCSPHLTDTLCVCCYCCFVVSVVDDRGAGPLSRNCHQRGKIYPRRGERRACRGVREHDHECECESVEQEE